MRDRYRRRCKRHNMIVSVAAEAREDRVFLPDYRESDLRELVEDCTGFKLSEPEMRLAIVALEQGSAVAKESIWYC